MDYYDIAIIGCGPSGISAALEAQNAGLKTVLLEKEKLPRPKICGGGVVRRAAELLPFDIEPCIDRSFSNIFIHFTAFDFKHEIRKESPAIYTVMRDKFDKYLFDHIDQKKVDIREQTSLEKIDLDSPLKLKTTGGTIRAAYVIGADGAHSNTAKLAGWKDDRKLASAVECELHPESYPDGLNDQIRFDVGIPSRGYGWVFPKKDHLSVGVGKFLPVKAKVNLKDCFYKYLDLLEIKVSEKPVIKGAVIPITPRRNGFIRNNVLLTGDAAGFADPLAAEGITYALLSGRLALQSIVEGNLNPERVEKIYKAKIKSEIAKYNSVARFLARVLYNHQSLARWIIKHRGKHLAEEYTNIYTGTNKLPTSALSLLRSTYFKLRGK